MLSKPTSGLCFTYKSDLSLKLALVELNSLTSASQQSVTKFMATFIMNLVTPKFGAKHEFLLNKQD
jgi:hypothetical protein